MAPEIEKMLAAHDAGLVIGDPALQIDRSRYRAYDLAEEWLRLTGKPFVFAFWAVREQAALETALDLGKIFQRSRDHGLEAHNLEHIAREWAPKLKLSEDAVKSYLTQNIHYDLDEACLDGLRLFYRYATECGALPGMRELRFLETAKPASR
jgi:chorismate dehydratase